MKYFQTVALAGSFAEAARVLNLNPSSLCRRITRLEDELGVTLFERGRRGIRLTSGGRAIIGRVHSVLANITEVAAIAQSIGTGISGELHLGIRMPPVGHLLGAILRRWRSVAPDVAIILHELNERDIYQGLVQRTLDAALIRRDTLWPSAATEVFMREQILVALPSNHPLGICGNLKWGSLRSETVLVQGWEDSQAARELYSGFLGRGVRFQIHPASKQAVLAMVAADVGVTLVTASQAEVEVPGVLYRPIAEPNAWIEMEMAWIPAREEPVTGKFLSFLRDQVRPPRGTTAPSTLGYDPYDSRGGRSES